MKKQLNIKISKDGHLSVVGEFSLTMLADILSAYFESVGGIDNYLKEQKEIIGEELDVSLIFDFSKEDTELEIEPELDKKGIKLLMYAIGEILIHHHDREGEKYEFDA